MSLIKNPPSPFNAGSPPQPASHIGRAARIDVVTQKVNAPSAPPTTPARAAHGDANSRRAVDISTTPRNRDTSMGLETAYIQASHGVPPMSGLSASTSKAENFE
jgi:hypothetical protein